MSELLKEFCELAPKEWGVVFKGSESEDWVHFRRDMFCIYLGDDRRSSEAIIFLWDYLKDEGWHCVVSNHAWRGNTTYLLSIDRGEETGEVVEIGYGDVASCIVVHDFKAPARIEALVRALIFLWRSK